MHGHPREQSMPRSARTTLTIFALVTIGVLSFFALREPAALRIESPTVTEKSERTELPTANSDTALESGSAVTPADTEVDVRAAVPNDEQRTAIPTDAELRSRYPGAAQIRSTTVLVHVIDEKTASGIKNATVHLLTNLQFQASMSSLGRANGSPYLIELIRDHGGARVTDDKGKARFDDVSLPLFVLAEGEHGIALVGERKAPEPVELELTLRPACAIEVVVVTPDGRPAPDVPLAATVDGTDRERTVGKTDERGVARYEAFDHYLGLLARSDTGEDGLPIRSGSLSPEVLGSEGEKHAFVLEPGRVTKIQMTLAESGSIDVRCPPAIDPSAPRYVLVSCVEMQSDAYELVSPDGRAEFARVALNKTFEIKFDKTTRTVAGPKKPGECIVVEFRAEEATGAAVITLVDTTNTAVDPEPFRVHIEDDTGTFSTRESTAEARALRFEGLPLGRNYRVVVQRSLTKLERSFAGPTEASLVVSQAVPIDSESPGIRVLLLDPSGKPLKNCELGFHLGNGTDGSAWSTDEAGVFRYDAKEGKTLKSLTVFVTSDGEQWTGTTPLDFPLPKSRHDCGILTLHELTAVVRGQVLRDGKPWRALTKPSLWVQKRRGSGWARVDALRAKIDADGAFRILGRLTPGDYRIEAYTRDDECVPFEPFPFRVGATDVRLEFESAAGLTARCLLDDAALAESLDLRLEEAVVKNGASQETGRLVGRATTSRGEATTFEWSGLRPGTYRMHVRIAGAQHDLDTLEGIELVAGRQNRDARLRKYDLRKRLQPVRLTFVGLEKAGPGSLGHLLVVQAQSGPGNAAVYRIPNEHELVLTPPGVPYRLFVKARGQRARWHDNLSGDATIELEPALMVTLGTAQLRFPNDYRAELVAQCTRADGVDVESIAFAKDGERWRRYFGWTQRAAWKSGEDTAVSFAATGAYTIELVLVKNRMGRTVRGLRPWTIEVKATGTTNVSCPWTQAELDAAIREGSGR